MGWGLGSGENEAMLLSHDSFGAPPFSPPHLPPPPPNLPHADHVYVEIKAHAKDALLRRIEAEREGEQVDRALLKNVLAIFQVGGREAGGREGGREVGRGRGEEGEGCPALRGRLCFLPRHACHRRAAPQCHAYLPGWGRVGARLPTPSCPWLTAPTSPPTPPHAGGGHGIHGPVRAGL